MRPKVKLLKTLPQDAQKRTLKLLQDVKIHYGIDAYLFMKKILTVGIITEYYQKKYHIGGWIEYEHLLSRNENLIEQHKDIPFIKMVNGLIYGHFFGIKSITVIKGMQMEVEMETYDYWEKRIEEKELN